MAGRPRSCVKIAGMTFKSDFQKGGDRARRSSGGGRTGIAVGGGLGGIVLIGLFLLLGGNPAEILGLQQSDQPAIEQGEGDGGLEHCRTGADANEYTDCRVEFTGISLDRVWEGQLPEQAGIRYTPPEIMLFSGQVSSGCGRATSATGPFYCPSDQTAYFDTTFFDTLVQMGGGSGPLAQQYVVAHEFGHHLQNLEGTLGLSDYNNPGEDSNAVKIETQADCYAGIWAHFADEGPDAILEPLTDQQVADAIQTARAIGDDHIQQQAGQQVNPDSWTHGSSQQRVDAFLSGYRSGSMASCGQIG